MSDQSGSTAGNTTSTLAPAYNSRSGRGRRKLMTEPQTERQAYMREQQRAFRQRKQSYLEELEHRCKDQEAEITVLRANLVASSSSLSSSASAASAREVTNNQSLSCTCDCAEQLTTLQLQNAQLQIQVQSLTMAALFAQSQCQRQEQRQRQQQQQRPTNPIQIVQQPPVSKSPSPPAFFKSDLLLQLSLPPPSSLDSDFDWLMDTGDEFENDDSIPDTPAVQYPSAQQIYGLPQTEYYFKALKQIPSLSNGTKVVDRLHNLYLRLSSATETKAARSLLLRLMRENNRMFDLCTVVEKVQAVDLLAEFYTTNMKYDEYIHNILNPNQYMTPVFPEEIPELLWQKRIQNFKAELKTIPSIIEAGDAVTDPLIKFVCNFWAHPAEYELTAEEFFEINNSCHSLLILMQNMQDRKKYFLTLEKMRQTTWREMDEMLAGWFWQKQGGKKAARSKDVNVNHAEGQHTGFQKLEELLLKTQNSEHNDSSVDPVFGHTISQQSHDAGAKILPNKLPNVLTSSPINAPNELAAEPVPLPGNMVATDPPPPSPLSSSSAAAASTLLRVFDPTIQQFTSIPVTTDGHVAISHVWGDNSFEGSFHGVSIKVSSSEKLAVLTGLASRSSNLPCWLDVVSVNQSSWTQFDPKNVVASGDFPQSLNTIGKDTFRDPRFGAVSQIQGMSDVYNKAAMTYALLSEHDFELLRATLEYLMAKGYQHDEIEMTLVERFQSAISNWQAYSNYMGRVWTYQELTVSNDITFFSHDGAQSVSASELVLLLFQLRYNLRKNSFFHPKVFGYAVHLATALFTRAFLPACVGQTVISILAADAYSDILEDKNDIFGSMLTTTKLSPNFSYSIKLNLYIDMLLESGGLESGWTFTTSIVPYLINKIVPTFQPRLNLDNEVIPMPSRDHTTWSRIVLIEVLAAMVQCRRKCYFKRDYINVLASLYAPSHITDSDENLAAKFAAFHVELIEQGIFTLRNNENWCHHCVGDADNGKAVVTTATIVTIPSWSSTLDCHEINSAHLYGDLLMRRSEHFGFPIGKNAGFDTEVHDSGTVTVAMLVESAGPLQYGDINVGVKITDTADKTNIKRLLIAKLAGAYHPATLTRLLLTSGYISWCCKPVDLDKMLGDDYCEVEKGYLAHYCYINNVQLDELDERDAWIRAFSVYTMNQMFQPDGVMSDLIERWFMYTSDSLYFTGNNVGDMVLRVVKRVGDPDKLGIFVLETAAMAANAQANFKIAKWKNGSYCLVKHNADNGKWQLAMNLHWSCPSWIHNRKTEVLVTTGTAVTIDERREAAKSGMAKRGKTEAYNPRSGRGRRKVSAIGGTDRQVFLREQQRAFRDRKQKYFMNLEEKCKALEAEIHALRVAAAGVSINSFCTTSATNSNQSQTNGENAAATLANAEAETIPAEIETVLCLNPVCAAQTAALKAYIAQLQSQQTNAMQKSLTSTSITLTSANLNGSSSPKSQNSSEPFTIVPFQNNKQLPFSNANLFGLNHSDSVDLNLDWLINDISEITGMSAIEVSNAIPAARSRFEQGYTTILSSEQLYGPAPIEDFKRKMKEIESLQADMKVVDRVSDIYVRLTRTTDTKTARVLYLRMVREANRLLALCTVVERVQVVEIISEFQTLTSLYDAHLHNLLSGFMPFQEFTVTQSAEWTPKLQNFRTELKTIPSLAAIPPEIIDPIIDQMCTVWGYFEHRDSNPEEFFQVNNSCHGLLLLLENTEDRRKFFTVVETLKASLWREMDELLADLEAVTI
ncbi:hypothetical protein HK100_001375 [Physocladia obscura]|uniref:BZIP domain-containing protein n=1 Tax=Physocladia obscura TaxID=109957 RepID=A0AAD5SX31_9FUNG|nr:hypothetical protein HK100_001375 [Physocladia obscura]